MWRKPASIEITLSQYEDPARANDMPRLSDFTDLEASFVGSRVEMNEGVQRRFFTYRMGKDIPMSPTDRQKTDYQEQWSMNTVLTEKGIQKHPDFPKLKKKYNGGVLSGDRVVWPRYIQDPDDETKIIKNPMFGVRGFLAPEVEVSLEKGNLVGTSMDFSQINEVGYVDDPKAFAFFAPAPPRNDDPAWATKYADWILVDKSFRVEGVDRIERKAWRSSWGGWPKAVYDAPSIQGVRS